MGKNSFNRLRGPVLRLLQDGTELLGLKLCFRETGRRVGLPDEWWLHVVPACLVNKDASKEVCTHFAGVETERALAGHPEGRIQTCPFGFTEIVVPVYVEGRMAGPLFAGPCWLHDAPPPDPSLVVPPDRAWLDKRWTLLRAVGTELGRLLEGEPDSRPQMRKSAILEYVRDSAEESVSTRELAGRLNLSPSRTTHLVRDLFGTSLPLLARRIRLRDAALELAATDLSVGEVAFRHGFSDQNYFSRVFKQEYGLSPRLYRQRYATEA